MIRKVYRIALVIGLAASVAISPRALLSQGSGQSDAAQLEKQWSAVEKTGTAGEIRSFLQNFPSSIHTRAAEFRLAKLLGKSDIAVPEIKALPARSSSRIACSLLPYVLRGTLVQDYTLGRPKDSTEVAISRTGTGARVGTVLLSFSGRDILFDYTVMAVPEHKGDLVNTAGGWIDEKSDVFDTGKDHGYWTDLTHDEDGFFSWVDTHAPKMSEAWWLFLDGTIHRFRGTVDILGTKFTGDREAPLTFAITQGGYVYLHGKGSVRTADGRQLTFPPSTPQKR